MTFLRPLRVVATVACLAVVGAACTTEEDESSLSGSQSASQVSVSDSSSGGSSGATSVSTTDAPASSSGGEVSTSGPGTTDPNPTTTVDPNTTSGGTTTSGGETTSGGTTGQAGGCGDGIINGNEQCDKDNLNGFTCEALGNAGGTLLCDPISCTFDTQMCDVGGSGGTSG